MPPLAVDVLMVRTVEPVTAPPEMEASENTHDAPMGSPLQKTGVPPPSEPFKAEAVIMDCPGLPSFTDTLAGEADKLKSATRLPISVAPGRAWPTFLTHPVPDNTARVLNPFADAGISFFSFREKGIRAD